ncbi:unnamed protein product [Trichogramma brassicae]|uniref:cyclin-dependent kinase n=1 Tax=Trichogramma brassicae TaxID=86971 RepID=A0A6H5IKP8_9HYME|nr:unnamed protein product [Trichogramma brassicae]
MASKTRFPTTELSNDLTSSPIAKKSRLSEDSPEEICSRSSDNSSSLNSPLQLSLVAAEVLPLSDESFSDAPSDSAASSSPTKHKQPQSQRQQPPQSNTNSQPIGSEMGREGVHLSLRGDQSHYDDLLLIGDGAYGTVYKAHDSVTRQVVALKKVRVPCTEDGLPTAVLREIAALKQLDYHESPYIVKLLDVCYGNYLRSSSDRTNFMLWLVFEHVERDLATYLKYRQPHEKTRQKIQQLSREILLGVDFLHTHRIVHRDLKPQNLLVTRDGHIKIADFGLAKTYDFEMTMTSVVVTLWYRSPEVLLGCAYATPVDIWSVGCIMAEIGGSDKALFPGVSEGDQLDHIFKIIGTPRKEEWPDKISIGWNAFTVQPPTPLNLKIPMLTNAGLDLVHNMLLFNPHSRPSAAQCLQHPYFLDDYSCNNLDNKNFL